MSPGPVTRIGFAGDVMIGRGVDQIMRRPGDPVLHESWVRSAVRYLELAENQSGPLPRGVDPAYVWGDTLDRLDGLDVDLRVVNLEAAVTEGGSPWPGKAVHYRVHPDNADCLVAGRIDAVTLANNHVLDWSGPGLSDTVATLDGLGIGHVGAGESHAEAWKPTSLGVESGRVVVLGIGSSSGGIDTRWAARDNRPGVALVESLSESSVERVAHALAGERYPGDVAVVSIHWGPNWGYAVPSTHRDLARALIDNAGVDVVHGHSSHHPLGLEVYRDRLILYGCGDLLTDYEGIGSHEQFRPELGAWYVADLDGRSGALRRLRLVPTKVHRFSLATPDEDETTWLASRLEQESLTPGLRVHPDDDLLEVQW